MLKTYAKSWTKINNKGGYFEDYNHKVVLTSNSIQIINLTNALKKGEECEVRTFTTKETISNWREYLGLIKISSFNKLIKIKEIEGFEVCVTSVDATDVYSPFVEYTEVVNEIIEEVENIETISEPTHLPETTTTVDCMVRKINLSDYIDYDSTSYQKLYEILEFFNTLQTDKSKVIIDELNKQCVYTFKDLFVAEEIENLKCIKKTESSNNICSPFVKVTRISKADNFNSFDVRNKPISTQEKITKLEVNSFIDNLILYHNKESNLKCREQSVQTLNKQITESTMLKNSNQIDCYKTIGKPYVKEKMLEDNMLLLESRSLPHLNSIQLVC